MRKIALVLVLALILATGTAFASDPRPDGFGIGIVGGGSGGWGEGRRTMGWNYGLALHAADIYWGINFGISDNWVRIAATGDFMTLVGGNITGPLGWYIDVGFYGGVEIWDPPGDINGGLSLDIGARLPIGLNLNFNVVDIWLAFIPRIGVGVEFWDGGGLYLGGGWGPEFGIRVWL